MEARVAKFGIGQVVQPPGLPVSWRDLQRRPGLRQYRGMVAVDSRGGAALEGPAVLPPLCREHRQPVRRLCLGAESVARRLRANRCSHPQVDEMFVRTDKGEYRLRNKPSDLLSPPARRTPARRRRPIRAGVLVAARFPVREAAPSARLTCAGVAGAVGAAAGGGARADCCCSSFWRCSRARSSSCFCSSSFCCSSTLGSIAGPSKAAPKSFIGRLKVTSMLA